MSSQTRPRRLPARSSCASAASASSPQARRLARLRRARRRGWRAALSGYGRRGGERRGARVGVRWGGGRCESCSSRLSWSLGWSAPSATTCGRAGMPAQGVTLRTQLSARRCLVPVGPRLVAGGQQDGVVDEKRVATTRPGCLDLHASADWEPSEPPRATPSTTASR